MTPNDLNASYSYTVFEISSADVSRCQG